MEKRKTTRYRMKSHIHAGQSEDKMLHAHHETEQHNMGCKPGQRQRERERKAQRENLVPCYPSSWSRSHRKGRQRSSHSSAFFPACHPSPAPAQQERAQSCQAGKDGKAGKSKGFCQRDGISLEGMSPPPARTHRWTPGRQQLTKGVSGFVGKEAEEEGDKEAPFTNQIQLFHSLRGTGMTSTDRAVPTLDQYLRQKENEAS